MKVVRSRPISAQYLLPRAENPLPRAKHIGKERFLSDKNHVFATCTIEKRGLVEKKEIMIESFKGIITEK